MAKNELTDVQVSWVSLVDRGDNPEARVVLWKRAGDTPRDPTGNVVSSTVPSMTTAQEGDTTQPDPGDVVPLKKEQLDELRRYVDQVEVTKAAAETERDEVVAERDAALAELAELKKGKGGKPFKGAAKPFGSKGDDDEDDEDDDESSSEDDEDDDDEDEMAKRAGVDDILKGASPELVDLFKRQGAQLVAQASQLEQIEKALAVERTHRLEVEFEKRAQALVGLGEPVDEVASVLKRLFDEVDDLTVYEQVEKLLAKAAMAADEAGLFNELGYAGSDEPEGDKLEQLLKMTDPTKVAKHGNDGGGDVLSPADLLAKLEADPDVYNEHETAVRFSRRGGAA